MSNIVLAAGSWPLPHGRRATATFSVGDVDNWPSAVMCKEESDVGRRCQTAAISAGNSDAYAILACTELAHICLIAHALRQITIASTTAQLEIHLAKRYICDCSSGVCEFEIAMDGAAC